MKDSDIEDLLRRYRPAGPPARLRERVIAAGPPRRIWPWAGAAAALLVSVLSFHAAARHELAARRSARSAVAASVTEDLAELLGGDAPLASSRRSSSSSTSSEGERVHRAEATDAFAGELR